ncbi:protein fuzzy homolog isoform X1 [Ammospiza caudacuta]|uniref:protein fuzzy homolog isoform X1 n=1 Tax=Ammospiza caudacuta TaxID=2857398 RepID=UPI002738A800|nr:protein fuzzy homolog isoform X1 [Ammospiza caudacuta]
MLEDDVTPCLVGVATASGLPLFCRPPRPQLPFSLVGALHGVRLFGAAAGAELREAATPTASLAWAQYGNSLTLVALSPSPGPAGPALQRILQSALGTLVLILGQEELLPIRNVERLKRDLRGCFPLLDSLLRPRGGGGEGWGMGGPCWPLPPGTPRQALQERLQRFAAAAQTELGCLLCAGGVAWLGTAHWGALPDDDSAHLRALLATPPPPGGGAGVGVAARDVAVFLPNSSPKVPLRLLWLRLLPGVGAGLLCGPRPSLHHVIGQLVPQFWGPALEQLRGWARPRPPPLPPEVLGYLLIHRGRSQSGIVKGAGPAGALPPQLRPEALRELRTLLEPQICPKTGGQGPPQMRPKLCYLAFPTHTGCCLLRPGLTLLLLLPPGTPREPLNPTALNALNALGYG